MAEFLIRLRGTTNGVVDLAGNTWTNNGVTIGNTELVTGGHSMVFANGGHLSIAGGSKFNISAGQDFTISAKFKLTSSGSYPMLIGPTPNGAGSNENHQPCLSVAMGGSLTPYYYYANGYYITSSNQYALNTATHIAIVRKNGVIKLYLNGTETATVNNDTIQDFGRNTIGVGYDLHQSISYFTGEMDDLCLIDGAVWDSDFTPPTGYLTLSSYAFLSGNLLYTGSSLTQLTNSWNTLTNNQKESLIESFSIDIPSISNLASISPFRVLSTNTSESNVKVTGQPKPQTITPTSLINTGAVSSLQSITVSNTITDTTVRFAITTDLSTYKVYDPTQSAWVTSTNIEEDGMSITQLNSLTPQILALLDVSNGIAFKQCFIATSASASAELSDISAVVNITGSWSQSVHGTDYTVSYPNNTTMAVNLLTNGDYIINYPITQ